MRPFGSVPYTAVFYRVDSIWGFYKVQPHKGRTMVQFEQSSEGKGKPRAFGMSKLRFLFANGVIGFLIICSLVALAFDAEPWPFSPYPMYSYLTNGTGSDYSYSKPQLYGVTQEEPQREIPLRGYYIQPFDEGRLIIYFERIDSEADPEKRQRLLNEAVRDFLGQYESLRLAGRHDGPPLQSIRLYQLRWQLDPQAQNVDQPDSRELLAEYEQF
jgi:hypothetical protein